MPVCVRVRARVCVCVCWASRALHLVPWLSLARQVGVCLQNWVGAPVRGLRPQGRTFSVLS